MKRVHNFSAGPAALPEAVLEQARDELLSWGGVGASVMEISHRDKKFIQIAGGSIKVSGKNSAKVRLHRDVVVDFHFEVVPVEA